MKICIISNTSWSIYNFRKNLIKALVAEGHDVSVMAPNESYYEKIITSWNCRFITLKSVNPKSISPVTNIKFYLELKRLFRENKFDTVFSFTPKPNMWGSIASKNTNINYIPTVNGLGHAFHKDNWLSYLVSKLYSFAFANLKTIFFQNHHDADFFISKQIVKKSQVANVAGSGVDLEQFYPSKNQNQNSNKLKFLFAGRFLKEKGILEYVEASKILKKQYPDTTFYLVGAVSDNPSSVPISEIHKWVDQGVIKYFALTDDMSLFLNNIDVLVFPSYYREGIPKVLLEAAAKEIPIITTNNVGCNQVIIDNYNGYVAKEKNVESVVSCMQKMILCSADQRKQMGKNGRTLVEEKFDEKLVIQRYVEQLEVGAIKIKNPQVAEARIKQH